MSERRDRGQGPRGVARLPEGAGCEHGSFIDEVWLSLIEDEDFVRQARRGRLSDLLSGASTQVEGRDLEGSLLQAARTRDEAIAHLRHLRDCGPCRARLRQVKTWHELSVRVGEIAASYDAPAIPPELEAAVLRGARDTAQPAPTPRRRWLSRRLAVAGMAAAAVLAAVYGFQRTGPSKTPDGATLIMRSLRDLPPGVGEPVANVDEILRALAAAGLKGTKVYVMDPAQRHLIEARPGARPRMNEVTLRVRNRDSVMRAAHDVERRWRTGALSSQTTTLHCGRNDIATGALVDSHGTVAALITQAAQFEMNGAETPARHVTTDFYVYREDGAEVGGIRLDQDGRETDVPSPLPQEAARARVERPECPPK